MTEQFLCTDCGKELKIPGKHICDPCREIRANLNSAAAVSVILIDDDRLKHNGQDVLRQYGFTVDLADDE